MKLACQEGLSPGKTSSERFENIKKAGYEGVEIGGGGVKDRVKELKAASKGAGIPVSTVCAGYGGCPLDSSLVERQRAIDDIQRILDGAAELGAVGMIFVPIFGGPRVPDLSPWMKPTELEDELVVKIMDGLADHAAKAGTLLILEPLNGYETHFVKTLAHAVRLCERVNKPKGLKMMADFFHMELEELSVADSICAAGKWICHVHLADNPRVLPGYGNSDFKPGFAALKEIKYKNFMALECGVPDPDKMAALKKTAKFLKAQM